MSFIKLSLQPEQVRVIRNHFQPLVENAYRTLGLSTSATQREVYAAADALRRAHKLGVQKHKLADLSWLGPVKRSDSDLRDALGRLASPSQRLYERLFWFAESEHIAPVKNNVALDAALNALLAAESKSARHDAALLALVTVYGFDSALTDRKSWSRALTLWREVVEQDDFWSFMLASELKGDFEPLITPGEMNELRRRTLRLVTGPLVQSAKDALVQDNLKKCGRALSILRDAALPVELIQEYEVDLLGPLEDSFDESLQETLLALKAHSAYYSPALFRKNICDTTLSKFEWNIKPRLKTILELAGPQSLLTRRAFEAAALALNEVADAYQTIPETELSLRTRWRARALAPPGGVALLQIEEELINAGQTLHDGARSEVEYFEKLTDELRPTPGIKPESSTTAPAFSVPSPYKRKSVISNSIATLAFIIYVAILFAYAVSSPSHSGYRSGPIPFNFNMPRPTPRYEIPPPIRIEPINLVSKISVDELQRKRAGREVVIVDVRSRSEYDAGHIPGAISIPETKINAAAKTLPQYKLVVTYCACPAEEASLRAALALKSQNIWNVEALEGGYDAWVAAGLPIRKTR